jgi:hypothetical protein
MNRGTKKKRKKADASVIEMQECGMATLFRTHTRQQFLSSVHPTLDQIV